MSETQLDRASGPDVQAVTIVTMDGQQMHFLSYSTQFPRTVESRYGKPRTQPKLPRKLKKQLNNMRAEIVWP